MGAGDSDYRSRHESTDSDYSWEEEKATTDRSEET